MILGKAIIHDSAAGLSVNCEDFDAECFGGADYEYTYSLDHPARDRLEQLLRSEGLKGSMESMIREFFGECLERVPFGNFCEAHGIRFDLSTWLS